MFKWVYLQQTSSPDFQGTPIEPSINLNLWLELPDLPPRPHPTPRAILRPYLPQLGSRGEQKRRAGNPPVDSQVAASALIPPSQSRAVTRSRRLSHESAKTSWPAVEDAAFTPRRRATVFFHSFAPSLSPGSGPFHCQRWHVAVSCGPSRPRHLADFTECVDLFLCNVVSQIWKCGAINICGSVYATALTRRLCIQEWGGGAVFCFHHPSRRAGGDRMIKKKLCHITEEGGGVGAWKVCACSHAFVPLCSLEVQVSRTPSHFWSAVKAPLCVCSRGKWRND